MLGRPVLHELTIYLHVDGAFDGLVGRVGIDPWPQLRLPFGVRDLMRR